ncbi:MAG: 4'-phosphopantetheinyl transferase superfamily protein, partial [Ignavibacteriae bacterium]|nr:4'-phosphopantetheinyl transferase superfamily protein [Ignavibacteriota bacterium]
MISSDWKLKYDNFQLTVNEIHVWLLDIKKISKSENDFNKILSDDELDRKNKFHFEKDRIVFGTTRGLLKILLAKYLKCSTNDVKFIYNEFGKPFLRENHSSTIRFNVSHSKDFGLLAFNLNNNIGVDIEYINKELVAEDIARNYFSEYEISELFNLNELDRIGAFYNIWTRKEAFIKAIGKGLS